jgi:hypothetical protein
MLLRRVISHLRAQEWTAIAIDFVIVVVGVFIGIQVSNWNAAREKMARAETLSQRLHDDFGIELWLASSLLAYNRAVYENAVLVLDDLTGAAPLPDDKFMVAAFRASQFNNYIPASSTYRELVSTGGLELVAKTPLGGVAAIFYEASMIADMVADGRSSDYRRLYRSITPVRVQLHLSAQCGDRYSSVGDVLNNVSLISYPCELKLPAEKIKEAASVLRARAELAEALRLRIATLATQNYDFGRLLESTKSYRASKDALAKNSQFIVFGAGK